MAKKTTRTTKKAANKPGRRPRAEQQDLPAEGFGRKVAPAIDAATKLLLERRAEKRAAKEAEDGALEKLIEEMHAAGVAVYKFVDEGEEVTVRTKPGKEKVTVTRKKPAAASDEAN